MPRILVYIAESFPDPVAAFLAEHGYIVMEAESASEAARLSTLHNIDAVIVAGEQEYPGLAELQQRRMTVNLTIHASGPEVFLELSNILPTPSTRPQ
jgi:hypothetical protein